MENLEEKLDSRNMKSWLIPNEVTAVSQKEDQPSPNSKQQSRPKMKTKQSGDRELDDTSSQALSIDVGDQTSSDRERLWGYLFANINRSIDELYQLCEEEKSVGRCDEAIVLFSKCQTDFQNLISQINEQERFLENQTGGVSWEVRKPVYRSPQVCNGSSGLPPTPTTPLPPPLQQPLPLVSKLSATAPPFHPKLSQPPVAMTPQKTPENLVSPSSEVSGSPKLEMTTADSSNSPQAISPSPLTLADPSIGNFNPPEIDIESQSEHDESHDERNDQSSDDREALEVAIESELVWAETEAWVEAELIAEEEAWSHLLQPLSSDLDTDADDTDSKETRFEGQLGTPRGEYSSTPDKQSTSLMVHEHSDDQDINPPDIPIGSRLIPLQPFDSPTSPGGLSLKSPHSSSKRYPHSPSLSSACFSSTLSRLHDKLSSPDRTGLRNQLTTEQFKLRQETKQSIAESNRDKSVREIKQKAMVASNRIKASEVKEAQRVALAEQLYRQKLEEAEKRHSEYIKSIRGRAGNENTKVSEVLFINSLNEDALAAELQRTLEEVENRILAGRKRREELLTGISDQQRRRNRKKVEQMSELRLSLEREKMERWEKIQKRLETVRIRREERLAELQRRTLEARESVVANTSDPLATIETDKEDHTERLKQKKEMKKEKRKKLQSVDDNAILDIYLKQQRSSTGPKLESQKNPLQVDEDTVDSILQDLKLSKIPLATLISRDEAEDSAPPQNETNSSSSLSSIVIKLHELRSRDIFPRLTYNHRTSALDSEGKRTKRKKKLHSDEVSLSPSDPSATPGVETKSDLRPEIDITDVLCSLPQSWDPNSGGPPFSDIAQLLYCLLNQDFGCLSALPLFLEMIRSPTPPAGLRSQSHRQEKEAPQQQCSVLEKVMQLLCSSLHLQPSAFVSFLKSRPSPVIGAQEVRSTESLLLSGTAFAIVDISRFAFVLIQKWGEKTFPLVLQHHQKQISKSLHETGALSNKIFWPPFILSLLPNLFSIIDRIMDVLSKEWSSSKVLQVTGVQWLSYFCLSGYIEQISSLFRDLQCIADFSEKDEFLSFLLCRLTQVIQKYAQLLRWVTRLLSTLHPSFSSPCRSLPRDDSKPPNVCCVSDKLRKCDLSWHLISLLGVLLLQDGLQSHSYRRQSHQQDSEKSFIPPVVVSAMSAAPHPTQRRKPSRRHSGGSSTELSQVDSTHSSPPIIGQSTLIVCREILDAINQLCQLDTSVVQALPSQMQALTLHVTERLLSCCLAKSTAPPPMVPQVSTHSARTGRRIPPPQPSTASASSNVDSFGSYDQAKEEVLAQTLIFVGYLCHLCPENQNFLSSGTPPSLLVRLCNLPVHYFTEARLKQILFPTLLSFCFENDSNLAILRSELNPILLSSFLESLIKSESLAPEIAQRFPRALWERAVEYFGKK